MLTSRRGLWFVCIDKGGKGRGWVALRCRWVRLVSIHKGGVDICPVDERFVQLRGDAGFLIGLLYTNFLPMKRTYFAIIF